MMFTAQGDNCVGFGKPFILNPHVSTVMVRKLLTPITLALDRRHEARAGHVASLYFPITFRSIAGDGALDDVVAIVRIVSVPCIVIITTNMDYVNL